MAYEYTTATLVEAELRASTVFSSDTTPTLTQVTNWIQEESAYINTIADMIFGSTAITSSDYEFIDYDGGTKLVLENSPILSIDSLEYNEYPIGSTLGASWVSKSDGTHFTTYKDRGVVEIIPTRWSPSTGSKRIRVTYTYGYSSTPLEVQLLATKLVAKRVLDTLITNNINSRNDGGTTSVGSITIVEPASYGVDSWKNLNSDIMSLKEQVIPKFKAFRNPF